MGVSGVVVAEILPVLLLAPVAGPLGDRWPRVRVMIGSDLCRVGLALVLAVWHEAPVAVYAVAFAMSVGSVFFNPAASSVLPALVRELEDLFARHDPLASGDRRAHTVQQRGLARLGASGLEALRVLVLQLEDGLDAGKSPSGGDARNSK